MHNQIHSDLVLTHRELQILELVAQGYSAKEVAQEISIAPRTVEGHIDTMRLKLRARNRAHMVVKAIAADVLTSSGFCKRDKARAERKALNFNPAPNQPSSTDRKNISRLTEQDWNYGTSPTGILTL